MIIFPRDKLFLKDYQQILTQGRVNCGIFINNPDKKIIKCIKIEKNEDMKTFTLSAQNLISRLNIINEHRLIFPKIYEMYNLYVNMGINEYYVKSDKFSGDLSNFFTKYVPLVVVQKYNYPTYFADILQLKLRHRFTNTNEKIEKIKVMNAFLVNNNAPIKQYIQFIEHYTYELSQVIPLVIKYMCCNLYKLLKIGFKYQDVHFDNFGYIEHDQINDDKIKYYFEYNNKFISIHILDYENTDPGAINPIYKSVNDIIEKLIEYLNNYSDKLKLELLSDLRKIKMYKIDENNVINDIEQVIENKDGNTNILVEIVINLYNFASGIKYHKYNDDYDDTLQYYINFLNNIRINDYEGIINELKNDKKINNTFGYDIIINYIHEILYKNSNKGEIKNKFMRFIKKLYIENDDYKISFNEGLNTIKELLNRNCQLMMHGTFSKTTSFLNELDNNIINNKQQLHEILTYTDDAFNFNDYCKLPSIVSENDVSNYLK